MYVQHVSRYPEVIFKKIIKEMISLFFYLLCYKKSCYIYITLNFETSYMMKIWETNLLHETAYVSSKLYS